MNILPAIAIAAFAVGGGTAATYVFDDAALAFRLAAGVPLGLTALGLIGLVVSALLGLSPVAIMLSVLLTASPLAVLMRREYRSRALMDLGAAAEAWNSLLRRPTRRDWINVSFCVLLFMVLWFVFRQAMVERGDGIYTTLDNYGDLPFHLGVISRFVYGNNVPPEDPIYAGARLTYPFLADFIAAIFSRTGATIQQAMFLEDLLLSAALVAILYRFGLELSRDRIAALLTPVVVLFSGGMGWCLLFADAHSSEKGILPLLANLPHNYTVISNSTWRFGNILTAMLLTQRSMLLGMPLALIVITQIWKSVSDHGANDPGLRRRCYRMGAAGLVAAMLPLAHAHSFIVVLCAACLLSLLFKGRPSWSSWAVFFGLCLALASPQIWWITDDTAVRGQRFFGWQLGWDRGSEGVIWFWLKNAGPFIVLSGIALMLLRSAAYFGTDSPGASSLRRIAARFKIVDATGDTSEKEIQLFRLGVPGFLQSPASLFRPSDRFAPKDLLLFYVPFALCFAIPNLFRLAPWIWDNIKIMVFWYIVSAPIVCTILAGLWRGGKPGRALSAGLLFLLTAAGGLEVWRVMSGASSCRDFNQSEIEFAELIRTRTPPGSTILHAPVHNDPVFLSGRRSLLGSPSHVWSHGVDIDQRQADIKRIYAATDGIQELVGNYNVDYAVVSPAEDQMKIDKARFLAYFAKVAEVGPYALYRYKFKGSRQAGAAVASVATSSPSL